MAKEKLTYNVQIGGVKQMKTDGTFAEAKALCVFLTSAPNKAATVVASDGTKIGASKAKTPEWIKG